MTATMTSQHDSIPDMVQKGLLFIMLSMKLSELQNTSPLSRFPIIRKGAAAYNIIYPIYCQKKAHRELILLTSKKGSYTDIDEIESWKDKPVNRNVIEQCFA